MTSLPCHSLAPPFFRALVDYAQDGSYSWHCPGHSGGVAFLKSPVGQMFHQFFGENMLRADVCNAVDELGQLLDHTGPVAASERNAARIFNSDHCYFVTNGTSTSNKIVWHHTVAPGDVVVVDRNCHKSILHAIIMTGAIPVFLTPTRNHYGIIGPIPQSEFEPESIRRKIAANPLLAGVDPDLLSDELFLAGLLGQVGQDPTVVAAAGPHGLAFDHEYGWVADEVLPDGRWRLAPPVLLERLADHEPPASGRLVLTNRREVRRLNSVDAAGGSSAAQVRLHPSDAAGIEREQVRVTSRHGSIVATVRGDDRVRPGTVSVNHGHAAANVAALTSATDDVDPLTGMPHASGVEVTISPA